MLFMRLKASLEKSLSCDIDQKKDKDSIRATYYIFCCRNRNWDSPDLMQFRFDLIISFLLVLFILFIFFWNNPISSSIYKLPIPSEIYNCTLNTNKVSIIVVS